VRIIAGTLRGRRLEAPPGEATRPTSDRARQALFDMLWHAPWAGRGAIEGAHVLDAFAGTGALGLEALSRGAAHATFLETDRAALATLRRNVAACRAEGRAEIVAGDATRPPRAPAPCGLLFLDPPYGRGLAAPALAALDAAGWVAPGAILSVELGPEDALGDTRFAPLAERRHGKARLVLLGAPR